MQNLKKKLVSDIPFIEIFTRHSINKKFSTSQWETMLQQIIRLRKMLETKLLSKIHLTFLSEMPRAEA